MARRALPGIVKALPALIGTCGKFWADDWIVIRPDRTLIFIDGQYVRPIGTAQDR